MGRAPTSTALARRKVISLIPRRRLKAKDLTDASISTLDRASILRYPQAMAVAAALKSIEGRPLGNRILVLPLPPDDHYGRIIIPDNSKEEQISGIVVGVGKGRYENGVLIPPDVTEGNYVTFSKYAARKVKVADIEIFQIFETDIIFAAGGKS